MAPGDLVLVERRRSLGGGETQHDVAVVLRMDRDRSASGYEPIVLILRDDGQLSWEWIGGLTAVD